MNFKTCNQKQLVLFPNSIDELISRSAYGSYHHLQKFIWKNIVCWISKIFRKPNEEFIFSMSDIKTEHYKA